MKTFITPLEREDIQALAAALYKIPKTVEKIGERILICPKQLRGTQLPKHVELLDQAAEDVVAMVKDLRKGIGLPRRARRNGCRRSRAMPTRWSSNCCRDLYVGEYEARQIMFLRDLFDLLEKAIDRCRDAGNVILADRPEELLKPAPTRYDGFFIWSSSRRSSSNTSTASTTPRTRSRRWSRPRC